MSQPTAFACTFDDAGDVGDDELGRFIQPHDAEMRLQRGERIVGDLRLGRRDHTDERRLSGIRKSDESDVGHQLQFEFQPPFLAMLALFGEFRCTASI